MLRLYCHRSLRFMCSGCPNSRIGGRPLFKYRCQIDVLLARTTGNHDNRWEGQIKKLKDSAGKKISKSEQEPRHSSGLQDKTRDRKVQLNRSEILHKKFHNQNSDTQIIDKQYLDNIIQSRPGGTRGMLIDSESLHSVQLENDKHDKYAEYREDTYGRYQEEATGSRADVPSEKTEWHEVFGTLSDEADDRIWELERQKLESFAGDEGEDEFEKPHIRLSTIGRKHAPVHYGRKIERLAKKGKIAEAVDVLETEMLKEDRVMPTKYVFTTLIGSLGRVGYTDKAFSLFNKMKKMGLKPEDPTYTALFNACANSPFKEKALIRARHLQELMAEKDYQPNSLVYKAMMKAFGICGDIQTAFGIVDEMVENKIPVDEQCFRHLLVACISDKKAGFKHAIEVWRKMRKKKISPDVRTYNLLLRAVRDCGAGDPEFANELISKYQTQIASGMSAHQVLEPHLMTEGPSLTLSCNEVKQIRESGEEKHQGLGGSLMTLPPTSNVAAVSEEESRWWTFKEPVQNVKSLAHKQDSGSKDASVISGMSVLDTMAPNILNPRMKFKEVIALENLDKVENRLILLGGAPGLLSHMKRDNAVPDIRTFSLLLDCIPSNPTMEEDLLATMVSHHVKPNIDFLSLLIRKRNLRNNFSGAKDVLRLIAHFGLMPNIRTFGCLAMGCRRKEDGLKLLTDIDNMGMLPTVEVFNILIKQSHSDFDYKLALCKQMKNLEVRPDEIILRCIENQIATAKCRIVDKEKGKAVSRTYQAENYSKDFGKFMMYYKEWLLSMELDVPPHPWDQFRPQVQDQLGQTGV